MAGVYRRTIDPHFVKPNGTWKLDLSVVVPADVFVPTDQALIELPPAQVAGNHQHKRHEAIMGFGPDTYFVWQDEQGEVHEERMQEDGVPYLFVVDPYVPHAVINKSTDRAALLYEYFNGPAEDIVEHVLVEPLE